MRFSHGTIDPDLGRLAIDNAAETFDWLMDIGFEPLPGHPVAGKAHEPYRKRRYSWGEKLGVSILDALKPVHDKLVAEGRIDLKLSTRLTRLLRNESGAVTGIEVQTPSGSTEAHHGKNVVLACGGYAARAVGFSVVSPAGVDVDSSLRVVQANGAIIPKFYAAGEAVGFTKVSGNAFVGGMSLMPALAFGRLLGQQILTW